MAQAETTFILKRTTFSDWAEHVIMWQEFCFVWNMQPELECQIWHAHHYHVPGISLVTRLTMGHS